MLNKNKYKVEDSKTITSEDIEFELLAAVHQVHLQLHEGPVDQGPRGVPGHQEEI